MSKSVLVASRYAPRRGEGGEWSVVDRQRSGRAVVTRLDAPAAALVAGLMNGDLAALARVNPETLASCRAALDEALRAPPAHRQPAFIEPGAHPATSAGRLTGTFH